MIKSYPIATKNSWHQAPTALRWVILGRLGFSGYFRGHSPFFDVPMTWHTLDIVEVEPTIACRSQSLLDMDHQRVQRPEPHGGALHPQ